MGTKKIAAEQTLPVWSYLAALILLTVATFIIYSNTLNAPFVLDDLSYIKDNSTIRNLSNFWPPSNTRSITYLSFALNYHFNGINVFGYHLVNTLIHLINGLFIYGIIVLTNSTPRISGFKADNRTVFLLALSTALLFIVHPIQTESVTYLTQRFASLGTLMYLLGLLLFILARKGRSCAARYLFYALSLFITATAQITKEICFTLPFIITLYEFTFFNEPGGLKKRLCTLLPFYATLVIIPLILLFPVQVAGGAKNISDAIMSLQVKEMTTFSRSEYLITQFRVLITYIRLLLLPVAQNFEYDYPVYTSIFGPAPLLSLLALLLTFAFAIYIYIKAFTKKNLFLLLAAFGIFWFFITISIESSIIPIQHVIFEHRLYLPSIGAFLTAFSLAYYSFNRFFNRTSFTALAVVAISLSAIPLGIAAVQRNSLWNDEQTLYEDMVAKSPNRVPGHTFLGRIYFDRGKLDLAAKQFETSLRLRPSDVIARFDLTNLLIEQGQTDRAIEELRTLLEYKPDHVEALTNLGSAYLITGRLTEAVKTYNMALKYKPNHKAAHYNLYLSYSKLGNNVNAERHYRRYLQLTATH